MLRARKTKPWMISAIKSASYSDFGSISRKVATDGHFSRMERWSVGVGRANATAGSGLEIQDSQRVGCKGSGVRIRVSCFGIDNKLLKTRNLNEIQ